MNRIYQNWNLVVCGGFHYCCHSLCYLPLPALLCLTYCYPSSPQPEHSEALLGTALSSAAGLATVTLTAALRASALSVQGHGHCPAIPYETTACKLGIVLLSRKSPGHVISLFSESGHLLGLSTSTLSNHQTPPSLEKSRLIHLNDLETLKLACYIFKRVYFK